MLHMVIVRHSPESCPGRPGNEAIHPCLQAMGELLVERTHPATEVRAVFSMDPEGSE